jgi:poly(A) polymerase
MQTRRLPPQPWMSDPATEAVLRALAADGAEIRFVGGCVRDAAVGRPVKDIDIATPDRPETVTALLERAGIKAVPTGLAHGTVTAVADGRPFEVTTLRRDLETDGRHAKVEFTDDWLADASRRDLTFNALSLRPSGELFDPFDGLADLQAGRVRFVGEPRARIEEDVLRLLRFFRFYAHFGKPPPDEAALAACTALAPKLPDLSGERVQAELFKLLAAPDPAPVLALMRDRDVLKHLLPEATAIDRLAGLVRAENASSKPAQKAAQTSEAAAPPAPEAKAATPKPAEPKTAEAITAKPDSLRRLAALLVGGEGAARRVGERLKLSGADRDRLVQLGDASDLVPSLDERERRLRLYRFGPTLFRDRALLGWAIAPRSDGDAWHGLVAMAEAPIPEFPLKGRDALELGLAAGPEVGRLLAAVERWWTEGDFRADRKACLARLKELAGRAG